MRARVLTGSTRTSRARRGFTGIVAVLSLCAAGLVALGTPAANAVQATGSDVVAWNNGWAWTYQTTFDYDSGDGTTATIQENATYTVVGREVFQGQDAYKLNLTGTITGGSGKVKIDPPQAGVSQANLNTFSGTVTGHRYVRVSDLALLQEKQTQNLKAKAQASILTVDVTALIDLTLTPNPSWKVHDFPLNAGDSWTTNTNVDYEGGFTYDAGSLGGTGSSPFGPSTLPLSAPSTVTNETVTVPVGTVNATKVTTVNADQSMQDISWWSPNHRNQAKEILVLPLDGAKLTITRNLSSASIPNGAQFSATATPSFTCAGATVTVNGNLSTGAAGVPVTVKLDQSQINPGTGPSASTTTGAGGAYSVNLQVPSESDGLAKNGAQGASRANWGVSVLSSATTATGATTVVVTPTNCSSISYTGATSSPVAGSASVSAQLTDLTGASAAGRTVTFTLGGGGSVQGTTNASGVATATLPMNGPVRNTTVTASYAGSAGLAAASTSTPFAVQVNPTSTTVVANPSTVTIGDDVTFSATVTPAIGSNPGGAVQFLVDGAAFGAPRPVSGGVATSTPLNTGPMSLGNHVVEAVYNGDANFGPSSSAAETFRVRVPLLPSSASLSIVPNSTVYGQGVTLSTHVTTTSGSGNPTGSVTFKQGGTVYGTAPVDGSGDASITTTTIPVGSHSIIAEYSGDDEYNGATSAPGNLVVAKADVDVALTSSDTTTVSGEAVDFGVTVGAQAPGSGTPDGTVQLVVDGNNVGSPVALVGGVANFDPYTSFLVGNHTVAVSYSGSSNYKTGSDSLTQEVSKADTTTTVTVSPSPSSEDQNVTITAFVGAVAPGGGAATGLVSFTADGDPIGAGSLSASSGGAQATLQISTLTPGNHTIVATYEGDADYNGSVSPDKNHTVIEGAAIIATKTTVTSSANPSTYGEFISFTAKVEDDDPVNDPDPVDAPASGAVQFSVDGVDIGDPVEVGPDGTATSPLLASPEPGDHTVIASFVGNPGWGGSGDFLVQTVEDAPVSLSVVSSNASSSYGQGVTFTATATTPVENIGDPDGHVQFRVDGVAVGGAVTLVDGVATSPSVSNLTPGTHTVTADYSGSAHFSPALASTTQDVGKVSTTTALVASPSSISFGASTQLTATVTPGATALGAPTGTVTFTEGSTVLGTAAVGADGTNGKAVLVVSGLTGGAHAIKATYSGATAFSGSASSTVTVTVAKVNTTITARGALVNLVPLAIPLGALQATVLSANGPVAGVPVQFKIGNNTQPICTSYTDAYGVANCNALPNLLGLTLGGFKASFAGDGNYNGSQVQGTILK